MKINFNTGSLGWLCFAWSALILLGIAVGLNWPFVLACVGTFLYLITISNA
jgi:hypothetical protein